MNSRLYGTYLETLREREYTFNVSLTLELAQSSCFAFVNSCGGFLCLSVCAAGLGRLEGYDWLGGGGRRPVSLQPPEERSLECRPRGL